LVRGRTSCASKKNKRGRIVEKSSSIAQEEGAQKNYVPPFGGILAPPSYYDGVPMQAWGSGAAMPPPNFAVPNVAFVEPYAHLPQPQQSVAKTIYPKSPRRNGTSRAALLCFPMMARRCVLSRGESAPSRREAKFFPILPFSSGFLLFWFGFLPERLRHGARLGSPSGL
jgi:hypothetical protein